MLFYTFYNILGYCFADAAESDSVSLSSAGSSVIAETNSSKLITPSVSISTSAIKRLICEVVSQPDSSSTDRLSAHRHLYDRRNQSRIWQ